MSCIVCGRTACIPSLDGQMTDACQSEEELIRGGESGVWTIGPSGKTVFLCEKDRQKVIKDYDWKAGVR